eukprot:Sdes_comp18582_c0_seq1m8706
MSSEDDLPDIQYSVRKSARIATASITAETIESVSKELQLLCPLTLGSCANIAGVSSLVSRKRKYPLDSSPNYDFCGSDESKFSGGHLSLRENFMVQDTTNFSLLSEFQQEELEKLDASQNFPSPYFGLCIFAEVEGLFLGELPQFSCQEDDSALKTHRFEAFFAFLADVSQNKPLLLEYISSNRFSSQFSHLFTHPSLCCWLFRLMMTSADFQITSGCFRILAEIYRKSLRPVWKVSLGEILVCVGQFGVPAEYLKFFDGEKKPKPQPLLNLRTSTTCRKQELVTDFQSFPHANLFHLCKFISLAAFLYPDS